MRDFLYVFFWILECELLKVVLVMKCKMDVMIFDIVSFVVYVCDILWSNLVIFEFVVLICGEFKIYSLINFCKNLYFVMVNLRWG